MAIKFEKTGNYLVLTDSGTGKIDQYPTKETYYDEVNENFSFSKLQGGVVGDPEGYDFGQTAATGEVDLTGGGAGSVDTIKVDAIDIMSGAVNYNTSLTQTASDVAANITAHTSTPNYTAVSAGTAVIITSVVKGTDINGLVVVSTSTTITTGVTNMAGASAQINDTAGVAFVSYAALITFVKANTGA